MGDQDVRKVGINQHPVPEQGEGGCIQTGICSTVTKKLLNGLEGQLHLEMSPWATNCPCKQTHALPSKPCYPCTARQ